MRGMKVSLMLTLVLGCTGCVASTSARYMTREYEPAQQSGVRPLPQPPVVQGPPNTEIYLASLAQDGSGIHIGSPVDITNNPGYDNQPFFTPDGRAILFTSMRDGKQTDIYRYSLAAKRTTLIAGTPESEYSPTISPAGMLSVVRVELDGHNTQRLWQFKPDGTSPRVVLEDVKPVGYYAWADDHTLALFILGASRAPATLQLADTLTGRARIVATDIGRSIQRVPGTGPVPHISFVQR
ncbi:MAG: TolB family protein, partial [Vicinamibacterales bacterium]